MKRLLFLLLLIPALSFGQQVYTYGGKVVRYGSEVAIQQYCDEYQAVYDAYTTKPDDATATIWNTCVESWVASGEWATKDVIYVYAAHTNGAGEALINWKNPGTFDATAYNAPTFTANEGFIGNGTTQYIDCNWVPSVSGVNFTANDASMAIYIRTNIQNSTAYHGTSGNADSKNTYLIPRTGTDKVAAKFNGNSSKEAVNADGSGFFIVQCLDVTNLMVYRNKVQILAPAFRDAKGAPTHSPYALAYNDDNVAGGFLADQVSCYAFGAGMTQANVDNFSDAFNTAMTALGKNVY